MLRMIRLGSALRAVVLVAFLLPGAPALACSCVFPTVAQAKRDAVAIFEGRVTSIVDAPARGAEMAPEHSVTLLVARSWRGLKKQEQVTLRTAKSGATCGYAFERGTSYLVYAGGAPGELEVNSCSRTRPSSEAGEDLAALGAGVAHANVDSNKSRAPAKTRGGGCASSGANARAVSLLWLGMPGLCLFTRRGRPA